MAYLDFEVNLREQSMKMGLLRGVTTGQGNSTTLTQEQLEEGCLDGLSVRAIWQIDRNLKEKSSQK